MATSQAEYEPQKTTNVEERRIKPTLPGGLERVPTPADQPVTGEVPEDLLKAVLEDLAAQTEVKVDEIQVVRAEAVVWNDGSLGCPQPDVLYTQAPVSGYWVVLLLHDEQYDYRLNENGYFTLCTGFGLKPGSVDPPGTPSQ